MATSALGKLVHTRGVVSGRSLPCPRSLLVRTSSSSLSLHQHHRAFHRALPVLARRPSEGPHRGRRPPPPEEEPEDTGRKQLHAADLTVLDSLSSPWHGRPYGDDSRLESMQAALGRGRSAEANAAAGAADADAGSAAAAAAADDADDDETEILQPDLDGDSELYEEDLDVIHDRIDRGRVLTTSQKILLLEHWIKLLSQPNPPEHFLINPYITWTHPRDPELRPGLSPPRMEEKYVPFAYSPHTLDAVSKRAKGKAERRDRQTAFQLERAVWRERTRDVRRRYLLEFRDIRQRRDEEIVRDWRAVRAAVAERNRQRAEQREATRIETLEQEEKLYAQTLQRRRQRVEARLRQTERLTEARAAEARQLLDERRRRWINDGVDRSFGVNIDERVFNKQRTNVTGFWS